MTVRARKTGFWRSSYEISADDRSVTTFDTATWRGGGTFHLGGRDYRVTARGGRFELHDDTRGTTGDDTGPLAVAERVGRRDWTVTAGATTYRFRRVSAWRGDQALLGPDGRTVGEVRRASMWTGGAVAELPGLDPGLQVFVVAVVLRMWDAQAAAAAAGG